MKLKGFQVTMYKNVRDSGWIEVDDLTVVVGKNESGKTTLLKALHKLNPFAPEPYIMDREWPRGYRKDRNEAQVVCRARFKLTADESKELFDLTDEKLLYPKTVDVTRDYAGNLEVSFDPPPSGEVAKLHPSDIDRLCAALPEPSDRPIGGPFDDAQAECREQALRLAREGRITDLIGLQTTHAERLRAVQSGDNPQRQHEENFINAYTQKLGQVAERLKAEPTMQSKAHDYIVGRLPTFIYMDEYRTFTGTAFLDQVQQRFNRKQPTAEDKTLVTIMTLAGLDLKDEVKKASQDDREQRQYDLSDAGATLTRAIENHWGQLRYQVQFGADGQQFFTFVRDAKDKGLIRLEERSRGFQWFFSFDLLLMHESKGEFKDCVLLIDEPGLHLHPEGQEDLLRRLDEYAKANTLIYSSHLPFMIDLRQPERIRVVSETPDGAKVTQDLSMSQLEGRLTLQAALGISASQSYLVAQRNLVVEGADDFMLLTELSNLFIRSEKDGLPEDVFVTAAGGAPEVAYIATFMIGQKLDVVALLDSDRAGDEARDKLVKRWLTRYQGKESQVLSLGPAVGVTGRPFAGEDLFPDAYYLDAVKETYAKQLAALANPAIVLTGNDLLCDRVERALDQLGIKLNKGSVAKRIRAKLVRMKSIDELPKETREHAEKLFAAIRAALPEH